MSWAETPATCIDVYHQGKLIWQLDDVVIEASYDSEDGGDWEIYDIVMQGNDPISLREHPFFHTLRDIAREQHSELIEEAIEESANQMVEQDRANARGYGDTT